MTEFYDSLEPEIRELVRVLRDNGINTTSSCGHKMYVEADVIPDGLLHTMHRAVFNYLAETKQDISYSITVTLEQNIAGLSRCIVSIQLALKSGTMPEGNKEGK